MAASFHYVEALASIPAPYFESLTLENPVAMTGILLNLKEHTDQGQLLHAARTLQSAECRFYLEGAIRLLL